MKKAKLVFHVIGYKSVGLGHIYRSLSLAKELNGYEVIFTCAGRSEEMTKLLVGNAYKIFIFSEASIYSDIKNLNPDIVINDVLSTNKDQIRILKEANIRVVNFEDLGSGTQISDLTINELYEQPDIYKGNILWGHQYFFLRDEFLQRQPNQAINKVESILITFGGTDSRNITRYTLDSIYEYCDEKGIFIYIVSGPGYQYFEELEATVKDRKNIHLTHATGVISEIMQKVQIAITSNGRTVYELAHMNIPSIVISQHERESEHKFSSKENGMINIGIFNKSDTREELITKFQKLVEDNSYLRELYDNSSKLDFSKNKKRIIDIIRKV